MLGNHQCFQLLHLSSPHSTDVKKEAYGCEGPSPGFDLLCSLERQNDCASMSSVGQGVRTGSWLFHWVPQWRVLLRTRMSYAHLEFTPSTAAGPWPPSSCSMDECTCLLGPGVGRPKRIPNEHVTQGEDIHAFRNQIQNR